MSGAVTAVSVAATAIGAVSAIQQQKQAKKAAAAQEQAAATAAQQAKAQADKADQDYNRANQKKPNAGAMAAANQQAALAGGASTMLTGAQGVDPTALPLGKNTLLGQ